MKWLLVTQSRMSTTTVSELARLLYENKSELGLDNGFASRIEPAATDKDAALKTFYATIKASAEKVK